MQIAMIVPAPFDTISGGYEYDRRIVAGLSAAGHEVVVHALEGRHPLADAAARASAQAQWGRIDPDAVIVIDGLAMPSFDGLAGEFARRRVVILNHHPTGLETGIDPATAEMLNAAERAIMAAAAHVIVTSATTAATLAADFGVAAERITVIEPGTEAAARSVGSGAETVNILSVGSLIARKGHDVLLRALAGLFDLDWHLTIVGSDAHDPVTAAALRAMPEGLGIGRRVTFTGALTGAPLEAVWASADVFALATHYEGYGMVIAEALAHGLPVAVCGGGAAGALITQDNGVVCPPGDVAQLGKALRRLIFDTGLRARLADGAWASGRSLPGWAAQAQAFARAVAG